MVGLISRALIFSALLAATATAQTLPAWVGVWGYPPAPLPAGAKAKPVLHPATVLVPPFLIDNPGNLPVINDPPAQLADITARQIVRVAAAGKRIRLRFSNEDGLEALVLGAIHVGLAGADGQVIAGTDHAVTFGGREDVTIPAWAPYYSDAVDMPVKALDRLAISVFLPGTVRHSGHELYQYVADGSVAGDEAMPAARLMRLPALVTAVDVAPQIAQGTIVTLGDSITEGAHSTVNAFRSWPDRLAERLVEVGGHWSVVNAGIGGNRLVRNVTGPNALARLDRDVFAVSGARIVVLMEGINDIGRTFTPEAEQEPSTLEDLENAAHQIVQRAHDHRMRVYGATLTPYQGAHYFAQDGETMRQAFNQWIRTSKVFDRVLDFDLAVRAKDDPQRLDSAFDAGDHLHMNDQGYHALGDSVPLEWFGAGPSPHKHQKKADNQTKQP